MASHQSFSARLVTDEATAHRIMDAAAETLPDVAAAMLAEPDGRWAMELHFSHASRERDVRDLVRRIAGDAAAPTVAPVAPRDWIRASLEGLKPVAAGRFVVHGGHDRARVPANRIGIEVEAALAFGTGHHGTTRGCLLALDALAKRASKRPRMPRRRDLGALPLPGGERVGVRGQVTLDGSSPLTRAGGATSPRWGEVEQVARSRFSSRRNDSLPILDVGTGSGVLAMAAAKALRRPVMASDIDKSAVVVARDNVRLNRTAVLVTIVHATGLLSPLIRARAPYDLVFANILLAPLKRLAAPLARVLVPGGRAILSGLLRHQANAALASYAAHGLRLERRIDLDGWVTLVMVRVAPAQAGP